MNTMLALPLVALILGADKVTSNDCCSADQYSAGFAQTYVQISNSGGESVRARMNGDAEMDFTGRRYALNFTYHEYNEKTSGTVRYIFLYKEEVMYTIFNDLECVKQSHLGQEPAQCLPDDAELDDSLYVGKNSLQLNNWKMSIDGPDGFQGDVRLATTQEDCIPVASSLIATAKTGPGEYENFVIDEISFNYTSGLGPSPFIVPDICKNATQKIKDERVSMFKKWNLLRKGMIFF